MSLTTPSEIYYKTRRLTLVLAGTMAVIVFVGFSVISNGAVSVIPFQLNDPERLPDIIAVVLAYSIWHLFAAWAVQDASVRSHPVNKVDFIVTLGLSLFALIVYGVQIIPFGFVTNIVNFESSVLISIAAAVTSAFWALRGVEIYRRALDKRALLNEKDILNLVAGKTWILWFNPASPNAHKRIEFLSSGEIGEGRNRNENAWRASGKFLEIINDQGQLFSRFRYNLDKGSFEHTNDADTLSIKSQIIYPIP